MARFILLIVLTMVLSRAFWRLAGGVLAGMRGELPRGRPSTSRVHMERDPVCGTFVVPATAVPLAEGGGVVYFCSITCRDAYRARTA